MTSQRSALLSRRPRRWGVDLFLLVSHLSREPIRWILLKQFHNDAYLARTSAACFLPACVVELRSGDVAVGTVETAESLCTRLCSTPQVVCFADVMLDRFWSRCHRFQCEAR